MDQSYQYAQQQQQRTPSSHSGFSASALSPQSSAMRSSGHSQQQYRTSLSSNSPSTPDKHQQQKVSLSSSISPTEPLYGGMTLKQLEAQAIAAANMNRSTPSSQGATALAGRSWHTGDLTSSSSSAFTHPHASKTSLPSTTASLYHSSSAGGLNSFGLLFDPAQLGSRVVQSGTHKVMSPDALLSPGKSCLL